MLHKLIFAIRGIFGRSPEERNGLLLFYLTSCFNIAWCVWITLEAFQINTPGHTVSGQITLPWQGLMVFYTSRNGFARWNNDTLDGPHWGRTIAILTFAWAIWLYTTYLLFPYVLIPDSLYIGLSGLITNIGTWQIVKEVHKNIQTKKNELQVNGLDGQKNNNSIPPDLPDAT